MRTAVEARTRWQVLKDRFQFPSVADVKQALESKDGGNPCEDGIRSICWRAFLLQDSVGQPDAWFAQVSAARDAYTSLRDHFLKYIERPDDLPSTADPLAEDEESPWQILRSDENIRAEIFQDVERCFQENHFFSEPATKARMLDILFIYAKLNPDLGYRQGMHELLAPVLWVVALDAIDKDSLVTSDPSDDAKILFHVLDSDYIEHDAFSLFCAIMRIAKQFYEHNDVKDPGSSSETSSIVAHSHRIHQVVLRGVDPELADHLHAIDILPQIFVTRWIRLLFGREFSFEETLSTWDILFAENLEVDLIDLVCVAMLLRIRQRLLASDYSSALGLLLRYPSPKPSSPADLVRDGLFLQQNLSPNGAVTLSSRYPEDLPGFPRHRTADSTGAKKSRNTLSKKSQKPKEHPPRPAKKMSSPGESSDRVNQKGLDVLFQDVSGSLYRRAEGWGVATAVRGAVGNARRNLQSIQSSASSPALAPAEKDRIESSNVPQLSLAANDELRSRVSALEARNGTLAKQLDESLARLHVHHDRVQHQGDISTEGLDSAMDTIRYVKSRLENSRESRSDKSRNTRSEKSVGHGSDVSERTTVATTTTTASASTTSLKSGESSVSVETKDRHEGTGVRDADKKIQSRQSETSLPARPPHRAPLADSHFSWMLGESGHQNSFMTCASAPPERKREGENRERPRHLFGDSGSKDMRKSGGSTEGDGVLLNQLRGEPER